MKKLLTKALNIEPGEGLSVGLMMAQSFFIGAFIITVQISTNALFLKEIGGDALGKAYMISGLIGITLTSIFSFFQKRVPFSILSIITYILVGFGTIVMYYGFELGFIERKALIYWAFLLIGPFIALVAYITFWGVMGRIYNLRQGKRLFGVIDSGQILAMIIISFAIPFLGAFFPKTEDLMLLGAISLVLSLVIQIIVSIKFRDLLGWQKDSFDDSGKKLDKPSTGISLYLKNPYILMLASFVFLSMLAQFFIEYSFMKTVNNNFPEEEALTQFFGFFMGTLLIFTFVFKTFVYGWLVQTYGLKVNLLILPLILVLFTLLASLAGTFTGYSPETGAFMWFFMFIIFSKLMAQSLRSAIEVPAFKIFYQPLDKNIRYDVQSTVDGFVNELSAFLGGVILTGLELLPFVKLIHFSWLLLPIIFAWMWLTIKLYDKYKVTLKESLTKLKTTAGSGLAKIRDFDIKSLITENIITGGVNGAANCIRIAKRLSPNLFQNSLQIALKSKNASVRAKALEELTKEQFILDSSEISTILKEESNTDLKAKLEEQSGILNDVQNNNLTFAQILKLARSKYRLDREKAAKILSFESNKQHTNLLSDLLKDVDYSVRKQAIFSIVKLKKDDLYLQMVENLSIQELKSTVFFAVRELNSEVLDDLNAAFYKAGFNSQNLCEVVALIGEINGERSVEYLLAKLTYPDLNVIDATLRALRVCNYQATGAEKNKISQNIEDLAGVILWNFASLLEVKKYEFDENLEEAVKNELHTNFNHLFTLLSLCYDAQTITHIRENIESGTAEGIGFAVELLDMVIDDALKPKLFPLLDDLKVEDRIKALQIYFPRFELSKEDALRSIMNRSYSEITRWTKACAIWNYSKLENPEICDDLIAQMFNPDKLLRQLSAWVVKSISPKTYNIVLLRLKPDYREELISDFEKISEGQDLLLFDKIILSKNAKSFEKLNGNDLATLIDFSTIKHYKKGDTDFKNSDNSAIQLVWKGKIEEGSKVYETNSTFSFTGDEQDKNITLLSDTVSVLEISEIYNLMVENKKIAETIISLQTEDNLRVSA